MNIRNQLTKFKNPVLIVHGEDDFIMLTAPRKLHQLFPFSKLVLLKECGHIIWLDQPEIMRFHLRQFLAT